MVPSSFHFAKCWYHLGYLGNLQNTRSRFGEPTHLRFLHCQQWRLSDCQSISFQTNGSHQRNFVQYRQGSWKRFPAKRNLFATITTMQFVSDKLWRPVLTVDGRYKISHALLCAEWSQNRGNSLIIANQMKWGSLNSEHNSSPGTFASELTFPSGFSTSYCDPDLGPSVKWNPSRYYPHSCHCHPHNSHFPYFPWCQSHQIGASHHTPSLLVTSRLLQTQTVLWVTNKGGKRRFCIWYSGKI